MEHTIVLKEEGRYSAFPVLDVLADGRLAIGCATTAAPSPLRVRFLQVAHCSVSRTHLRRLYVSSEKLPPHHRRSPLSNGPIAAAHLLFERRILLARC